MSSSRESESQRQVRQMVNFIMQEANEKVNELRIKTDHDFNLERQNLVHAGKQRVQEEYAQKAKDLEIQQRVARSTAVATSRVKKMKARDDLLQQLKAEALAKLAAFTKSAEYGQYLKNLIIQGLIKIEEPIVEIQARQEDKALVAKLVPSAVDEYKALMQGAGHHVQPTVTVSEVALSSKQVTGGVLLSALGGRIILDQTMDERLNIAYTEMMPSVRYGLFPEA